MAQFGGLQGLGAPINYYDTMIPDFRREALQETQNRVGQQQVIASQMQNQQAQRDNQRRQDFYAAIESATPDQLPALRRQFPEFAQNIQQEIGIQSTEHASFVHGALNDLSVAAASGNPQAVQSAIQKNGPALSSLGVSQEQAAQLYQQDPQRFNSLLNATRLATLPMDKQFETQQNQQRIDETVRSNKAGEGLQARGQNITMRGQDMSAATARRGQDMASQRAGAAGGQGDRVVQLADGRTVNVGGKLHGAGANAFYEGIDNAGNIVRVPASSIAAPATSAASAQNYAMKKDLDAISGASADDLGFMTGVTGSSGSPALGADIRSRASGGDQRKLYNAAQRVQGKIQNQGIAAARDMGASGINTVAEAKMYFQGMPQVDYSSPEAMQQSMRDIQQYTDNYNQQYQVDVGNGGNRQQTTVQQPSQQPAGGSFTSKSGIQFTVK
ncbi:phage DNA ejection protein [Citrobacter portucalensis]|uniref:Phage DNA ejection protein n=1 Tax=Citrobacter portucalensis TaxID=1639133 RepID=A0ABD5H2Q7_9ENTR|nr:phage DNA ejection protein [Citrobacter portucalensis]MDW2635883.1 phage DNA ejection protein [Citrobacter portucalensis]